MLETAVIVRIIVSALGVFICIGVFFSYCRQHLTEKIAFLWAVFGVAVFLCGALLPLSGWAGEFDVKESAAAIVMAVVVLFILYSMSRIISDLTKKNQELAMQVSLLNNENEQILNAVHHLLAEDVQKSKLGEELSWAKRRRYS